MQNVVITRTITQLDIETNKIVEQPKEYIKRVETVREAKDYIESLFHRAVKKGYKIQFIERHNYGLFGLHVHKSEVSDYKFEIEL